MVGKGTLKINAYEVLSDGFAIKSNEYKVLNDDLKKVILMKR
jgi:hypothetical protein